MFLSPATESDVVATKWCQSPGDEQTAVHDQRHDQCPKRIDFIMTKPLPEPTKDQLLMKRNIQRSIITRLIYNKTDLAVSRD